MRRPSLHAVVLALLVATAGCSGFAPQSADNATTTDDATVATETTAETTATETTTEGEVAAGFPPGLTEDGVLDATALSDAHRERLDDESLTIDSHRVERYANGTLRNESSQTTRTAANRTRYRILVNTTRPSWVAGSDGEGELWANGTHVFHARAANGTMEYDLRIGPDSEPVEPRDYLRGDLTNSDRVLVLFTAFENESVERMDGGNATHLDRYRVTASDLAHPEFIGPDDTEVRNATLDAVIESDGPKSALVREYTIQYEISVEGEIVRITEQIRFSNVGETTVERPEWYDGTANRTD